MPILSSALSIAVHISQHRVCVDEKLRSLRGTLPSSAKKDKNPLSLFEKMGLSNKNLCATFAFDWKVLIFPSCRF